MTGHESVLTNSDIIALSSGVVALCAFFVSIFQTFYTMRHNKLQVRPLLSIESASDTGEKFVAIHNLGLGPALIERVTATYRGLTYDLLTQGGLDAVTDHIHGYDGEACRIYTNCLQKRSSIPSSGCEKLIRIHCPEGSGYEDAIDAFIQSLVVEAEYVCIYGTRHRADNRTG